MREAELHRKLAHEATVHPFLEQCKSGVIQARQFNTWLVQDYLFVVDFTRMVGRILAITPPHHFDVILGGLSALQAESAFLNVAKLEKDFW